MTRHSLLLLLLIAEWANAAPALPRPDQRHGPVVAPIVGRPGNFSEAVGTRFEVTMRTSRTELFAGQTLTLTVRVTAMGRYWQAPDRPNLEEQPRFNERFKIDRSANTKPDRVLTDQRAWEFDYKLRPRPEVAVERIPPLQFIWYRPSRNPNLSGYFPTTYGDEIDIKVKPVTLTPPPIKQVPIQAPDSFFEFVASRSVLAHDQVFQWPSLSQVTLILLTPPVLVGLWYVLWRRLYPDAARIARIRQSRAAVEAFRALASLGAVAGSARVARIAAIAAQYLRYRFDLRTLEPTPAEVAEHLERSGIPTEPAEEAADFFRACDAARFAPVGIQIGVSGGRQPPEEDLARAAHRLITTLEAEPWSRRS